MNNIEILKERYKILDRCYDLMNINNALKVIILASRNNNTVAVNIALSSKNLKELWSRFSDEDMPDEFKLMTQTGSVVFVDVTALEEKNIPVRIYQSRLHWYNFDSIKDIWPAPEIDFSKTLGLGIYTGNELYKFYQYGESSQDIIKYTYKQGQLQDRTREIRNNNANDEELKLFGIYGLELNQKNISIMRRENKTAVYMTFWDSVEQI
jgi:hypothetical protein